MRGEKCILIVVYTGATWELFYLIGVNFAGSLLNSILTLFVYLFQRRSYFEFHPHSVSTVLGAPDLISHLPPAEPIIPGHTLLRPALGMLKSQIKFPHRELENGAGVYGNIATIGLK